MDRFDVVVVGGRCAGAPLAMLLARAGLRVCVLDKARFPSDTPSTHVVQPFGVAVLHRLGVLDAVLAAGAARLDRFTLVNEDVRIDSTVDAETLGTDPSAAGGGALCIRRVALDALLLSAAAAAGVDVRSGTAVTGLRCEDGRVTGVRTDGGEIHAALVVGADGRGSSVARFVGAAEYHTVPAGRTPIWGYFEGVADRTGRLRIGRIGDLALLSAPTEDGLYLAGIAPSAGTRRDHPADRDAAFRAGFAAWPELADLLAGATRVGPLRTMPDWHGYFRESAGKGWVLAGDAGHFKDPTPAQGMADAFRQSEQLAGVIASGLDGAGNLDTELKRWWHQRDRDCYEMHWLAADMGAPGPSSPLITELMRGIAEDPAATVQLMRTLNRDVRPAELFTAGRLAKAAAAAARNRPREVRALAREVGRSIGAELRRARRRPRAAQ